MKRYWKAALKDNLNKFLIDSNSLITPFLNYYTFDFAPKFWKQIELYLKEETVVIMDVVYNEILKGEDELSDWLKLNLEEKLKCNNLKIIENYSNVLNYINQNDCYMHSKSLSYWAPKEIADSWLIAAGKAYNYTVVTFEKGYKQLSPKQPVKKPKIPDVCEEFGVSCISLFDMMRKLSIKL